MLPPSLCRYSCKNPCLQSETVHYKRGVSQQFSLPSFKIDFSEWKDDEVTLGEPLLSLVPSLVSLSSGWYVVLGPKEIPPGAGSLGMARSWSWVINAEGLRSKV